jgi:diguanylate cyclase (GGDEF)-like protein/PAS domain S-box-containing protein
VYVVDRERKILYWNRGAEAVTGYLSQEMVGRVCGDTLLVHCDEQDNELCSADCPVTDALRDGTVHEADIYLRHRAGYRVPVRVRVLPLRNKEGGIVGAAEIFLSDPFCVPRPDRDSALEACGCLDLGTGLPDPGFTRAYLHEEVELFRQHRNPFGTIALQVEQMDDFQNLHGAEAASAMLRVVAQTMRHALRAQDFVGRWRRNLFLAIVPHCDQTYLEKTARRLRQIVGSAGLPWWGDVLSVKVTAGTALVCDEETIELLRERIEGSLPGAAPSSGEGRETGA